MSEYAKSVSEGDILLSISSFCNFARVMLPEYLEVIEVKDL